MELLSLDPERDDLGQEALDAAGDLERSGSGKTSQATRIVRLTAKDALWHNAAQEAFISVEVAGHIEHHPIRSKAVRRLLAQRYFQATGDAPGNQGVQDALAVLEGQAVFAGEEHECFVRLAGRDGAIWLDLGDEHWRAVRIDSGGWEVVDQPPVRFRRPRGMLALPVPTRGGRVDDLRNFIHVSGDDDWRLSVSWLLAALRPTGPFPLMALYGEQGSGKSTTARLLSSLVDPRLAALRAEPKDVRDVAIASTNGWLISFDNLSHIPSWLSDVLCRLSTGGGFATRELYSDQEEAIFDAQRPAILTAIEEVAVRGDLLDRCLVVTLPTIPEHQRRTEKGLWSDFERERPAILGALLDAVSAALRNLPAVKLDRLPRMADFAVWSVAAAPALGWTGEQFLESYSGNRQTAHESALEAAPWTTALRNLKLPWEGTASQLLDEINRLGGESATRTKGWPARANALSNALRRAAPTLRATGIDVTTGRTNQARTIRLEKLGISSSPSSPSSLPDGEGVTMGDDPGPDRDDPSSPHRTIVTPAPGGSDDGDDGDDLSPYFSNGIHTNGTAMVEDDSEEMEWTL